MMSINEDKIERFLKGSCTPEEKVEMMRWLADDKANTDILENYMKEQWDGEEGVVSSSTDDRLLSRFLRLYRQDEAPVRNGKIIPFRNKWWGWAAAAAIAVFLVLAGVHEYSNRSAAKQANQSLALSVTGTGYGEMKKLVLADGSQVWLNAASRLSYPAEFNDSCREVYLQGEAFFDIAPESHQPFVVHSGELRTTVLGTSFNVKCYDQLQQAKVTVATGKVAVGTSAATFDVLHANQQLSYDAATGQHITENVTASHLTEWRNGIIRLDGVSFTELAMSVQHTWGYTLKTNDPQLNKISYKTTFKTTDKVDDVIKTVCRIADAAYHVKDSAITLRRK